MSDPKPMTDSELLAWSVADLREEGDEDFQDHPKMSRWEEACEEADYLRDLAVEEEVLDG